MDKIFLENFAKQNSETHIGPSMICGRFASSNSQTSFGETSWSERAHTDGSSPIRSMESNFKPYLDDISTGKKRYLNWKQYLKDDKYSVDTYNFEKHRGEFHNENTALLKDLNRTRPEDPYLKKPSNISALQEIAVFYCNSTGICYQQGLLEMIAPFVKLRSPTFRTRQAYAYFASFMRNYFPNILTPITLNNLTELPHLNATINYCEILLGYHANKLSNIFKEMELDIRSFVTPWVMTLFTRGSKMELVYDIFGHYMAQQDKLFLFYIVIALLLTKQKELIDLYKRNDEGKLIIYLSRTLKEEVITSSDDVEKLFAFARKIKSNTPVSFEMLLIQMGLMNTEIISIQEYNEYITPRKEHIMEIYPFESVDYLFSKTLQTLDGDAASNKRFEYKFLDCRRKKEGETLPYSIEIPDLAFRNFNHLKMFIQECCLNEPNTHFIVLKIGDIDKEEESFIESVFHLLRAQNKNFVSIAVGGFKAIMKEIEQRKTPIPWKKKHRSVFLDKIRSLWTKTP